jgi:hypothetical protein
MKKCINKVILEGYLYEHDLKLKTVQDKNSENFGKEFINGTISIAVDEDGLNVVPVHYTYVTATTSKGTANKTYTVLKSIMDGNATWLNVGKDSAMKVKCDTAFALNDFYAQDGSLVSQMLQEGGFISTINAFDAERNKFEIDLLVTNVAHIEADEEKNIAKDYCTVRGAGFNFRNALLPMSFVIHNEKGMDYFESLEASNQNPVFIKVWGKISHTTTKVEKTEESAFGEASVTTYEKKVKEWIITGASPSPYDFGDESVMTVEDLQKAMQDREVLLADTKKRAEEYRASKNNSFGTPAVTPAVAPANKPAFNF